MFPLLNMTSDDASRAKEEKARRMLALAAEIRAHMQEPVSSDHGWLYGEDGLPA
jgi:hypothetical protein